MFRVGNYAFTVRVLNLFCPELEATVQISRTHRRSYLKKVMGSDMKLYPVYLKDQMGEIPDPENHSIRAGSSLAFPMFDREDLLEISLSGTPDREYSIFTGAKALCRVTFSDSPESIPPYDAEERKTFESAGTTWYAGGIWTFDPQVNWKLYIKKIGPDPEDDDIVIGADPPI